MVQKQRNAKKKEENYNNNPTYNTIWFILGFFNKPYNQANDFENEICVFN